MHKRFCRIEQELNSGLTWCTSLENLKSKFISLNENAIAFMSNKVIHANVNNRMVNSVYQRSRKIILWNWVNFEVENEKYDNI